MSKRNTTALSVANAEESVAASKSKIEAALAVIASESTAIAAHHQSARNMYAAEADAHDAARQEWERLERDAATNHQRAFDAMRKELETKCSRLESENEKLRGEVTEANRKLRAILTTVS